MSNELVVTTDELSLCEGNLLNTHQLSFLLKKTPEKYVRKRPAKGGGEWSYVSGGYVRKCLNLMFGWDWDFEILEQMVMHGEAIVKGRLTARVNGKTIIKTQFGNKDIIYRKAKEGEERVPLSIGNDLKAASTDCLKKCASELGIASDIYSNEEFREMKVVDNYDWDELTELFELKKDSIPSTNYKDVERIITSQEKTSYTKVKTYLQGL